VCHLALETICDELFSSFVFNCILRRYNWELHPEQPARSLTPDQLGRLRRSMYMVVKTACAARADSERFPTVGTSKHCPPRLGPSKGR